MFPFLKKKTGQERIGTALITDMHSHLLPGIDDGAKDIEQSISLVRELAGLGYQKLITSPHIMGDFYKNTPEIISIKLTELRNSFKENNIQIEIEAAAEYYLDEWLMEKIKCNEKLLSFGDNFLLFETSFMNNSPFLQEAVFLLQSQGYKPILAHPERYLYYYDDFKSLEVLHDKKVLLQININSLTGYYGKPAKDLAEKLIDSKMVSFAGTDCHSEKHIGALNNVYKSKYYTKLMDLPLLNRAL